MTAGRKLDKKTFNMIAGAAGILAVLVLVFGVLDFSPAALFRNAPTADNKKPAYFIHDEESFIAESKPYVVTPPQAPDLAFEINLPPEWTVDAAPELTTDFGQRIISEIARITGPYINIYRPQLIVSRIMLKHDLAADTWLRNYILSNSYILQGDIATVDQRSARAAFTYVNGNDVILVQSAVQFSGDTAVIARYEIPLIYKEPLGFVQKRAIESFKLTTIDTSPVEEQKPFTLADLVKFSYPQSWTAAAPDLRDINRINIQIYHQSAARVYQGYMHIFVIKRRSDTNIEQESQRLRDFITNNMKLDITGMKNSTPAAHNPRFGFSRQESYTVKSLAQTSASEQDLTLVALGNSNIYVFMLMLSPDPARDLYSWARNQRTLSLITQSVE